MILILGGTSEARQLATALVGRGADVLSSLAGRVSDPVLPAGPVRIGGFGGVDGLVAFLTEHHVQAVVDATHPFAVQISAHATTAGQRTGIPLLRFVRPGWRTHPDAGQWTWVASVRDVLETTPDAVRPFLTTGRQSLAEFLPWADRRVLARVVDPPHFEPPSTWTVLRARGPYDLASERALMLEHSVDLLVTKDSGGALTAAKLAAAADIGVRIVVIERPGDSAAGFDAVHQVLTALADLR